MSEKKLNESMIKTKTPRVSGESNFEDKTFMLIKTGNDPSTSKLAGNSEIGEMVENGSGNNTK